MAEPTPTPEPTTTTTCESPVESPPLSDMEDVTKEDSLAADEKATPNKEGDNKKMICVSYEAPRVFCNGHGSVLEAKYTPLPEEGARYDKSTGTWVFRDEQKFVAWRKRCALPVPTWWQNRNMETAQDALRYANNILQCLKPLVTPADADPRKFALALTNLEQAQLWFKDSLPKKTKKRKLNNNKSDD